jgi:uncharacterized membrane protein YecN with MAPEG domain
MNELHQPTTTLLATALLALIFAILSVLVVVQRGAYKVNLGSGEATGEGGEATASPLLVAVRAQANFAEYVPIILLLIGLIELRTGGTLLVKLMAFGLILARVMHPVGLRMKAPNLFRAGGFLLTILILLVASGTAVWIAVPK